MFSRLFAALSLLFLASCAAPMQSDALLAPYRDHEVATPYRFMPLEEGRLYSSMEPEHAFLDWLIREKGVRTFISIRGKMKPAAQRHIERSGGRVLVYTWSAYRVPPQAEIDGLLTVMDSATTAQSAIVFCKAGVDRTGFVRALWRIRMQGWSKEDAFAEFRARGHIRRSVLDDYLEDIPLVKP